MALSKATFCCLSKGRDPQLLLASVVRMEALIAPGSKIGSIDDI